ncbi:PLP-dependent aminotransferase family protein [Pseudothauera nasutitermitis]|uniref:PLP-dependent aminotransferase family protein n=1 Tax=Pseudothauera nasutitermitis TaxID=2565930 RepID=A0A4S4AQB9_9RHOO|nr:PLP-dependent aminotransferase family protein [Pseudothauera nasutitermitis]THF61937.1 PLP-dependent aminotransferase family protein [Pseudothauera nasutitermitis]
MLQLSLEHGQPTPLVEQIVGGIRAQIEDRILRPGMRVPPIRRLAETQGVSRFTVVEAYDRLVALGYLRSRRGSGFYVAPRREREESRLPAPVDRAVDVAWVMRRALDDRPGQIKAGTGWLPAEWMDGEGLRRHLRALSRRADARLAAYGTAQGYLPLRQQLQVKLAEYGIGAQPEQIVLTEGATRALDIVARHLIKPGDTVLVDDPGYFNFFGNLRLQGAKLVGVPRLADGPDTAEMEALLAHHRPKVLFTQSALHNPTGGNLSPAKAFRILQLAEKHDFHIIEDDVYADFQPQLSTRLANLDQLNRVIFIGSFSKTLSGSLRVGYLAARADLAAEFVDVKTLTSVSSSEFNEQLTYQMLTDGHYRKYVERLQGRLAQATQACLRMLERVGMEVFLEPKGGVFVWARPPGLDDAADLATRAAAAGIMLAPGKVFRPQTQASPWLRFNVAFAAHPQLERFLAETPRV